MNLTPEQIRKLTSEFDALHEGRLDSKQCQLLEQMIVDDSDIRQLYIGYAGVCAGLVWDLGGALDALPDKPTRNSELMEQGTHGRIDGDSPDSSAALPTRPRSWLDRASRHPKMPAIAVAFFALSALIVWFSLLPFHRGTLDNQDADDYAEGRDTNQHCAILTTAIDVDWVAGGDALVGGSRLWPGQRLEINKGLVEIEYTSGALVVIEGPAEFIIGSESDVTGVSDRTASEGGQLLDANSGFLKLGKLRARVDYEETRPFSIWTPITRVKDLGTEFAVDVGADGETRLHVREGEVLVGGTNGVAEVHVQRGGSLRVATDRSGNVSSSAVDSLETHFERVYGHHTRSSVGERVGDSEWVADAAVRPKWDSYVQCGFPTQSFNNENELYVKNTVHEDHLREAWMEFDLSGVEFDRVIDAELVLTVAQGKEMIKGDSTAIAGWEFEIVGVEADEIGSPESVTWESTRGRKGERLAVFSYASARQAGQSVAAKGNKLAKFVRDSQGHSIILVVKRITPADVTRYANSFASSECGDAGPTLQLKYSNESSD